MWFDHIAILRCPKTGQQLKSLGATAVSTLDERYVYPVDNEIICLLPERAIECRPEVIGKEEAAGSNAVRNVVQSFYDCVGWTLTEHGDYGDTRAFVDSRPLSYRFSDRCMRAMRRYLPRSGRYLLDAGSGAIPHDAYLSYHTGFTYRVCADFSKEALLQAKRKLGDRGVYLLADVTNLPIASDSMDAVTCNHVLYHIAPDDQPQAFKELWRVLKPGGVAAIVYAWSYSPLARRIDKLAERIMPRNLASSEQGASLPFFPQSLDWFLSQKWPFRYSIRPFRVVGNGFLRQYVGDNARSRVMLALLWCLQRALPAFVGRYGQHPAILISK